MLVEYFSLPELLFLLNANPPLFARTMERLLPDAFILYSVNCEGPFMPTWLSMFGSTPLARIMESPRLPETVLPPVEPFQKTKEYLSIPLNRTAARPPSILYSVLELEKPPNPALVFISDVCFSRRLNRLLSFL